MGRTSKVNPKERLGSQDQPVSPRETSTVRAFSFGSKPHRFNHIDPQCLDCGMLWAEIEENPHCRPCRKKPFQSEIQALNWISKRMKHAHKKLDWICYKVYRCPHCGKFHLTKALLNGKEKEGR